MLSEKKMLDKLYAQPEVFNEHIRHKEYAQASYLCLIMIWLNSMDTKLKH